MKDLVHIQQGTFKDETGKKIPVTRVRRLTANKYSELYMTTLAAIDVMDAVRKHEEVLDVTRASVPTEV